MRSFPLRRSASALLAAALLAGCSDNPAAPFVSVTRTITVDAAASYAFLALDTTAEVVSVTTPATSSAWDIGIFSTSVMLNGGAAGPGGVSAFCVCANTGASNGEVAAMTADNQLADFDAVTAATVPAAAEFTADALDPVINGWYTGSGASASLVSGRTWIVREGAILAKVHVTSMAQMTADGPGEMTIEYSVQPSAGADFGPVYTATFDASAAPFYLDLTTQSGGSANWDIRVDGWTIAVNGGVSGTGGISAVLDATTPFASITAAYAASAPPQAYRSDRFAGVFAGNPWYRYNITGTDNQIWPTYQVYLVRRGSAVFKVQLIGYYSATGTPRQITVRYAQLTQ